jgi:hypothetical protein
VRQSCLDGAQFGLELIALRSLLLAHDQAAQRRPSLFQALYAFSNCSVRQWNSVEHAAGFHNPVTDASAVPKPCGFSTT